MHLPKTLKPLRSSDVGLRQAAVSEDDPNNLILSTEAGVIIMTDLNQEIQVSFLCMILMNLTPLRTTLTL